MFIEQSIVENKLMKTKMFNTALLDCRWLISMITTVRWIRRQRLLHKLTKILFSKTWRRLYLSNLQTTCLKPNQRIAGKRTPQRKVETTSALTSKFANEKEQCKNRWDSGLDLPSHWFDFSPQYFLTEESPEICYPADGLFALKLDRNNQLSWD